MNKKLNTVLFLLGATVVNILITLLLIIAGLFLMGWLLPPDTSAGLGQGLSLVVFIGGLAAAFFIYNKIMKYVQSKIDMEKYFSPLLGRRDKKK